MRHLRSNVYSAEQALLNKRQIWGGAPKLDCYQQKLISTSARWSRITILAAVNEQRQRRCLKAIKYTDEEGSKALGAYVGKCPKPKVHGVQKQLAVKSAVGVSG